MQYNFTYAMLQSYFKLFGKNIMLQTPAGNKIAVVTKQSLHLVFLPIVGLFIKFNFVSISFKRKRALPEGNLPAIKLMATIMAA